MRKAIAAVGIVAVIVAIVAVARHSTGRTAADSLSGAVSDNAAGPFLVGEVPSGHAIGAVTRGTLDPSGSTPWCTGKVCASPAFAAWRALGNNGYPVAATAQWPIGSYAVTLDAPAPRVNDDREYLLPTGTALDVAMIPGRRNDVTLAASYNAMDHDGEHGPAHDVWFDRRSARVGSKHAVLTEGYGSDEQFPRDVKTLYFAGPHGELGIVRATTNVFAGTDIWDRTEDGTAGRSRRSHRAASEQQMSDDALAAVAASVRATTTTEFGAAGRHVEAQRICPFAKRSYTCALDDRWCARAVSVCTAGFPSWGDWQRSPAHAVYFEFSNGNTRWFALAPEVRSIRLTATSRSGEEVALATIPTRASANDVRWASSSHPTYRLTALDASGHPLETVRTDLAGP